MFLLVCSVHLEALSIEFDCFLSFSHNHYTTASSEVMNITICSLHVEEQWLMITMPRFTLPELVHPTHVLNSAPSCVRVALL